MSFYTLSVESFYQNMPCAVVIISALSAKFKKLISKIYDKISKIYDTALGVCKHVVVTVFYTFRAH